MHTLIALITAALVMGILDFIWLGFVAKDLYYGSMGQILRKRPDMQAAIAFYTIYILGVVFIVVRPALGLSSLKHALTYGAMLGFVAYATYDLTNLSTLKGFSKKVAVIDMIWGTFLTSTVSTAAYLVAKHLV